MPLIPVSDEIIGYEFHGDDGCELCQATSGSYMDEPERPHENCDCEIYEITAEDDPSDVEIEVVVGSKSITTSQYIHWGFHTESFENNSAFPKQFNFSYSENVSYEADGLSAEIEEYCDVSDLLTDFDISIDHDFDVEPGEEAELGINMVFKVTEIELTLEYKNSETGEVVETREFSATISTPIENGFNVNSH